MQIRTNKREASTFVATLNPIVSGVTRFGKQTISIAVGPGIPLAAPEEAKAAFGIRSVLTFVFRK